MDIKMLSNNKNIDFNGKDKSGKTFYMNTWINGHQDVVKLDFLNWSSYIVVVMPLIYI